ncbi:flagellar motor switch protein FliM [Thioflavicoccus mobilis 8321]|uniref:Flagellar motor switch protein FliM n=1 Tax=Thioflavicoccus mobilis 8321 TaxID=765912 RepID=L0GTK9_9GAMM|nr:flagellar motor switch protein FliM [Thioflavicoccus mobilis]AGA89147.1 flagellar motor switch protein FliM [Thioflavicoccus mobilis 8321]
MSITDLLTPEELDALLQEAEEGRLAGEHPSAEPRGEVMLYDFSAQDHIVRSSMPTLEMIYEKFSRKVLTTLSGLLRRGVVVELAGIESLRYADWLAKLSPHCGIHLVKVRPLQGAALFLLNAPLVHFLVDAYFGGCNDGEGVDERVLTRKEITDAELRVTRILIEHALRDLETAWEPVYEVALEHAGVETNPLFASIASPPERVIEARFDIQLGTRRESLSHVIPYAMVEPIKALLDNGRISEHADADRRWRESLVEGLQDVTLELRGTLVEVVVPVRRILTMRPGDVLPIDIPKQLPLELERTPVFRGALGFARGKKAVKITEALSVSANPIDASEASSAKTKLGGQAPTDGSRGSTQSRGLAACA